MTAEVPRLATPGNVQFVSVDGAGNVHPGARRRAADGDRQLPQQRRVRLPELQARTSPSTRWWRRSVATRSTSRRTSAGRFTFGLISCKLGTPIPDPWAMIVLGDRQRHHGRRQRRGVLRLLDHEPAAPHGAPAPAGLGGPARAIAFGLGEGPNDGPPGGINERDQRQPTDPAVRGVPRTTTRGRRSATCCSSTPAGCAREIEDYLRGGDHPLLSLRNGGTCGQSARRGRVRRLHRPGGPERLLHRRLRLQRPVPRQPDHVNGRVATSSSRTARFHARAARRQPHPRQRRRVVVDAELELRRADGREHHPERLRAAAFAAARWSPRRAALKNGLTILFGWAASGLTNLRADVAGAAAGAGWPTDAAGRGHPDQLGRPASCTARPASSTTIPATALRATPWSPATQADEDGETTEGVLLAAGPGRLATRSRSRGDRNAAQTRTIVGDDVVAQLTTAAKEGVTDEFSVVPRLGQVGYDPGSASGPLTVQMMARAGDGSTRTAAIETTTTGSDKVAFGAAATRRRDRPSRVRPLRPRSRSRRSAPRCRRP